MFGYIIKQRILNGIVKLIKNGKISKQDYFNYEELENIAKTDSFKASKHIANLSVDGYIEMFKDNKDNVWVKITDKGASAALGNYFHNKLLTIIFTLIKDITLTASNVAVAVIAYIALVQNDANKISTLELEISKIKELVKKQQEVQEIIKEDILLHKKDTINVSFIKR